MSKSLYCWRCNATVSMLDSQEAAQVWPLLQGMMQGLKERGGLSLTEAIARRGEAALRKYRELTGFDEQNVMALWHHVLSLYGPPCATCGKPLRTPAAKHCAACGAWA